jgi:hypothetical protein
VSTNINITVGDNALLDAAKLQQQANRQAQLNREASKRLEAQATAARTAALATQGRDANGNLISGAPFTQPQIERRPTANRRLGLKLYRFYQHSLLENGVRVRYLVSGNGQQRIKWDLFDPPTTSYGILVNTEHPEIPTQIATDALVSGSLSIYEGRTINGVERFGFVVYSFGKSRRFHSKSGDALCALPVGNGLTFVVEFNYFAKATSLIKRYSEYMDYFDPDISGNVRYVFTDTASIETESGWSETTEWKGYLVGQNTAREVDVPQALRDALILGTNVSTPAETVTVNRVTGINSSGVLAVLTALDVGYLPVRRLANWFNSLRPFGLVREGALLYSNLLDNSPALWLALDSVETEAAMSAATTHEELRAVSTPLGDTVGTLLQPRYYIRVGQEPPRAWSGAPFAGNLSVYPPDDDPAWSGAVKSPTPLAPPPLEPGDDWISHYSIDWRNNNLCRAQAARYGIQP